MSHPAWGTRHWRCRPASLAMVCAGMCTVVRAVLRVQASDTISMGQHGAPAPAHWHKIACKSQPGQCARHLHMQAAGRELGAARWQGAWQSKQQQQRGK